jgi:O-antigen biosynthesis protein
MNVRSLAKHATATVRRLSGSAAGDDLQASGSSAAAAMLELERRGPAAPAPRSDIDAHRLRIAAIVPSFRRSSGGHRTIVRLLSGLREMGHEVSAWLVDHEGRHVNESHALIRSSFAEFFDAATLPLHPDLGDWEGADLVLATAWQTVPRALMLPRAAARAYLVQDHEPDFYPASAEAIWAAQTYRMGLPCIAASRWLAQVLKERYGAVATHFDLGVDRAVYTPRQVERRKDLVVFYARAVTPRRAVPLGLAALAELAIRRPAIEIQLFGETPSAWPGIVGRSPHRQLGELAEAELAELYSRATVGLVFSLTNPSLIHLEMMACGLPCIELTSASMTASFPSDGPLQLVEPSPLQICAAVQRLLDDTAGRAQISAEGRRLAATRSWPQAVRQVEAALRGVLAAQGAR